MIRILSAMILLFALLSPARAGESRAMLAVQQILDQAHTSATDCTLRGAGEYPMHETTACGVAQLLSGLLGA
jgi:hypothetical protein